MVTAVKKSQNRIWLLFQWQLSRILKNFLESYYRLLQRISLFIFFIIILFSGLYAHLLRFKRAVATFVTLHVENIWVQHTYSADYNNKHEMCLTPVLYCVFFYAMQTLACAVRPSRTPKAFVNSFNGTILVHWQQKKKKKIISCTIFSFHTVHIVITRIQKSPTAGNAHVRDIYAVLFIVSTFQLAIISFNFDYMSYVVIWRKKLYLSQYVHLQNYAQTLWHHQIWIELDFRQKGLNFVHST